MIYIIIMITIHTIRTFNYLPLLTYQGRYHAHVILNNTK